MNRRVIRPKLYRIRVTYAFYRVYYYISATSQADATKCVMGQLSLKGPDSPRPRDRKISKPIYIAGPVDGDYGVRQIIEER